MGSEQKIIETLKKLKEANTAAISRQTGFSTAYVDILCKSLIKSGGLTKAAGKYSLAGAKKKAARAVRPKKGKKSKRKKEIKGWFPDWLN